MVNLRSLGMEFSNPDKYMQFAKEQGLFIAAFNHITPFPGPLLCERMDAEGRLLDGSWWLDDRYRYNMVPFQLCQMSPEELAEAGSRRGGISIPAKASTGRRPSE